MKGHEGAALVNEISVLMGETAEGSQEDGRPRVWNGALAGHVCQHLDLGLPASALRSIEVSGS